jgi:hypothetical protein
VELFGHKVIVSHGIPDDSQAYMIGGNIVVSPAAMVRLQQEKMIMSAAVSEAIMEDKTSEDQTDVIVEIVAAIEATDSDLAYGEVRVLLNDVDQNYFKAGGYLARIAEEGIWKAKGYESFKESVEQETGIHWRKAYYWMGIFDAIVESEIPYSKIAPISWTKMKEVASILTLENVDEWVAKIVGPPGMTVFQIQEAVKALKVGSLASSGEVPEETSSITSISFKVHADQKETIEAAIAKAKGEAETDFAGVALDAICMNYLAGGGGKAPKPKILSDVLKGYEPEDVLDAFEVVWPDIDVTATM